MNSAYKKTETVDITPFRTDLVKGFFGAKAAEYWHGLDCSTDRVIHLTPSGLYCVIRKISSDGTLPPRAKDPLNREWE